jgi:hypothetical protein
MRYLVGVDNPTTQQQASNMTSKQSTTDDGYDFPSSNEDELARPVLKLIRLKRKSPTSGRDLSVFFPPGRGSIRRSPMIKKDSPSPTLAMLTRSRAASASQPRRVPVVEIPRERPPELFNMEARVTEPFPSTASTLSIRPREESPTAKFKKVVEGVKSVLANYEARHEDPSKGHIQWPIHHSTEDSPTKGKICYLYCTCKTEDKTITTSDGTARCHDPACDFPGGWYHRRCLSRDERARSHKGL